MPVFGSMSDQHTGAASKAPLADLFQKYPELQQYAGQLGLMTDPSTLYGYQTLPPLLFPNQPRSAISTVANTPPLMEGVSPAVGESLTAQMAAGNANLGASVGLEQERRGNTMPAPRTGGGPPIGLPVNPPPSLVTPSQPYAPLPSPNPAPVSMPVGLQPAIPVSQGGGVGDTGSGPGSPGVAGSGGGTGGADSGTGVGSPGSGIGTAPGGPTSGAGVGTGPGGGPGGAGPGSGDAGGVGGPGTGVGPGGEGGGPTSGGGVGTGPGGGPGGAGPGSGDAGGGGGGAGAGGTVICSILRQRGYLSEAVWQADEDFGRLIRSIDDRIVKGYHLWARPLAGAMRRSPLLTWFISLLACPWALEMAHVMGARPQGNRVGRWVMKAGLVVCARLGRR